MTYPIVLTFILAVPDLFNLASCEKAQPETRAIAYLAREVPRWRPQNKCYSCHNNGDAARALYAAYRLKYPLPDQTLDETTRWLEQPQKWEHNGGEGPFNDKKLNRIQFAVALVDALEVGLSKDKEALAKAAELVAEHQEKDGSWQVDAPGTLGSPATYGACLATAQCRRTLAAADSKKYEQAIAKADAWLRKAPVKNVMDAAAVLLALPSPAPGEPGLGEEIATQRKHCFDLIRKGQSKDGGWGPYVNSASEPFDTALVVLALARHQDQADVKTMIQGGRGYLIATQQKDGSWKETTRPAGAESYAQRLSTTGWVTLALLHTAKLQ